jgi:regulator of sirC expression with transglutaminase-like and TPR domain
VRDEVNATCARARELLSRALAESPPRLDWAALAVAALDECVVPEQIEQVLDAYAQRVRTALGDKRDALSQVQALKRVLADEEGFSGDRDTYQAPENSFLTKVLERRAGLPITLSVLYLEVARRTGIPLFGVSFPGHFLVACEAERGKLVVDPFAAGQVLTEEGCADLLARVAPQVKFNPRLLSPATVPAIASRMLQNLKRTYLATSDGGRALQVIDLLLLITPDHPGELRARAALLRAIGAYRAALADVERCLALSPDSPDQESLRLTAQALRQQVDFLH